MTTLPDLEPAARQLITLAAAVTDDMLQAPTPCGDYTVADLLAHAMGLTIAFRDAADKKGSPAQDAEPGRVALDPGWREALPGRLLAMAAAWHSPQARPSRSRPVPRFSTAPSPSAAVTRAGQASFAIMAGHGGHQVRKYGYG